MSEQPVADGTGRKKGKLVARPVAEIPQETPEQLREWLRGLPEVERTIVYEPDNGNGSADAMSEYAPSTPSWPDLSGYRSDLLARVEHLVNHERKAAYGPPEAVLGAIADLWSVYIGTEITSSDVAAMMVLLKVARQQANPFHADTWSDIAGYGSIGGAIAAYVTEIEKVTAAEEMGG